MNQPQMHEETAVSESLPAPAWYSEVAAQFAAAMQQSVNFYSEAARIYVVGIDRDPLWADYLCSQVPGLSKRFLAQLEQVGRGQIDARIMSDQCPYYQRLVRMPLSEQRRAVDGPLELLVRDGDTLLVRTAQLMPSQAKQLFAQDHIRSLAEQRAWLEAQEVQRAAKASVVHTHNSVEIDKKRRCIFVAGVRLTRQDLLGYLRQIEG